MRVHKERVADDGKPEAGVFTNRLIEGVRHPMSTDWSRYSSPEETRARATGHRPPLDYGVIRMNVGDIEDIPQTVEHDPVFSAPADPNNPNNRAHTVVRGAKSKKPDERASPKVRLRFRSICSWILDPPGRTTGQGPPL